MTSTGDAPGRNRFEVTLDKGNILIEDGKLSVTELDMTEQEFSAINNEIFGKPGFKVYTPETDGLNPQHIGVLNSFASAILHGTPLVARGEEGINGLMISNAAHLSAWTGKTVSLPIDEDLYYNELMKRVAVSKRKPDAVSRVADTKGTYGT